MRADKQLIEVFLAGYSRLVAEEYAVCDWPDERDRHQPSVDAIARTSWGRTIAIEHTLLEPFVGEKLDTDIFRRVFVPLESDPALKFPGYDIELWPKVGAIPKGVPWDETAASIRKWLASEEGTFPYGESIQRIPGLPFKLEISTLKEPSSEPRLFFGRSGMPQTLNSVIARALERKLPKLADARADSRFLLFEKDSTPGGYVAAGRLIDGLKREFPLLDAVAGIWIANTVALQQSGDTFFYQIWPNGITRKIYTRRRFEAGSGAVEVKRLWEQTRA